MFNSYQNSKLTICYAVLARVDVNAYNRHHYLSSTKLLKNKASLKTQK